MYVAIKAKKHRSTGGGEVSKVSIKGLENIRTTDNGARCRILEAEITTIAMNDQILTKKMTENVLQNSDVTGQLFYFQPWFDPETSSLDRTVKYVTSFLEFATVDVTTIRRNVALTHPGKEKYIVLIVVADESPYDDLSAHLEAPRALMTPVDRPNMMTIAYDDFVVTSTSFIGARQYFSNQS